MSEPAGQDPAAQEGARIESLDERFGRIEHEQAEQRGLLEQIRDGITGAGKTEGKAHTAAQAHTQDRLEHPPAETIAEQVRRAVAEVGAEQAAAEARQQHEDHHKQIREAEQQPREGASGWRARLSAAMYGREPR